MISFPPRHGKSYLTSHHFPAWYLGTYPDRRVILTSYGADFAAEWGRKARDVLEEHGADVFGVKVRADSSAADRWDIQGRRGGMVTAGVGGPITGRGADLLIVDDPVKNAEEATSATIKDKAWEWFLSTAYTRLHAGGAVVLIMTRWAVDDLAGRILQRADSGGRSWEVLSLPALALESDPLGRQPGEALWPEQIPAAMLEEIRQTQGNFWFEAQYQGNPVLPDGNLFKRSWFRRFTRLQPPHGVRLDTGEEIPDALLWKMVVVDPAASEEQTSDYSAIGVFTVVPGNRLLVEEVVRERIPLEGILPRLAGVCARHNPSFVAMEANGFQVFLAKEAKKMETMPAIREVKPEGKGKLVRATPAIIRAEAGQVFLPAGEPPWLNPFVEELVAFTGLDDPHDDQVDVLAYGVLQMGSVQHYPTNLPPPEPRRPLVLGPQPDRRESGSQRRGLFGR